MPFPEMGIAHQCTHGHILLFQITVLRILPSAQAFSVLPMEFWELLSDHPPHPQHFPCLVLLPVPKEDSVAGTVDFIKAVWGEGCHLVCHHRQQHIGVCRKQDADDVMLITRMFLF